MQLSIQHSSTVLDECALSRNEPRTFASRNLRSSATIFDTEDEVSDTLDGEQYNHESDIKTSIESGVIVRNEEREVLRCICGATEDDPNVPWISCCGCNVWQHINCVNFLCELCSLSKPELTTIDAGLQTEDFASVSQSLEDTRVEIVKADLQDLQSNYQKKQRERQELESRLEDLDLELSQLHQAKAQRDKNLGWPAEELTRNYIKRICELNDELDSREKFGTFTKLQAHSREQFGETRVATGFRDVYSQSQRLLRYQDADSLSYYPHVEQHERLHNLVSGVLGISPAGPLTKLNMRRMVSTLSPQAVVRALTTYAVRAWVFETNFPEFDQVTSNVLLKYRELISEQGK